jgi:hypothetical protein
MRALNQGISECDGESGAKSNRRSENAHVSAVEGEHGIDNVVKLEYARECGHIRET